MVRNLYEFDSETSDFWYVVKDTFGGFEELNTKVRNMVRKAYKTFDIVKVDKQYMLENAYDVHVKASERYKVKTIIPDRGSYNRGVENADNSYEYWACIDKESGKLAAFAMNILQDDFCSYSTMKADPAYLKAYPFYGLIFEMNRYYLDEKKFKYVSDGARSITEHSNIQPFLIDRFNFRKAYCKMKIVYKWWFKLIVYMLFPFRNIIPILSVKSILRMEEINRTFSKSKK